VTGAPSVAPRRYTPTQRSLAASLLAMSEPLAGPDDKTVVLPVTLSARSGRSRTCGTVYAHARALGQAVTRAPGQAGWLVDLPALRAIAHHQPQPFGPTAPPTPAAPTLPRTHGSANPASEVLALLRDVLRLAERLLDSPNAAAVADADQLNARLRDTIAGLEPTPTRDDPAIDSRKTSRNSRETANLSRSPDQREGESFSQEVRAKTLSPSLNDTTPRDATASRPSRTAPAPASSGGQPMARPNSDLEALLGPLVRFAQRNGLVGITDRTAAATALAPYSDEQIRHAVNQTLALTKAGIVTDSPVGWLIAKARNNNPDFFPNPPRPSGRPQTPRRSPSLRPQRRSRTQTPPPRKRYPPSRPTRKAMPKP
jgi:hypothetical protein